MEGQLGLIVVLGILVGIFMLGLVLISLAVGPTIGNVLLEFLGFLR